MEIEDLPSVFRILKRHRKKTGAASVTEVSNRNPKDPYKVLISCIISLRTKDEVTARASENLFHLAATPSRMVRLDEETIAQAIFPAGFYKTKSRTILEVSQTILDRFSGTVPDTMEDLLELKGVGRKTANLVLTLGFGKPGICVDTHVHRITNRWGLVRTKTPEKTERALRVLLPRPYWSSINDLLVNYGRTVCTPLSPHCTQCGLKPYCGQHGVEKFR